MNKWERNNKYWRDFVKAMMEYADGVSKDRESQEYKDALSRFAKELVDDFKAKWEKENPEES